MPETTPFGRTTPVVCDTVARIMPPAFAEPPVTLNVNDFVLTLVVEALTVLLPVYVPVGNAEFTKMPVWFEENPTPVALTVLNVLMVTEADGISPPLKNPEPENVVEATPALSFSR